MSAFSARAYSLDGPGSRGTRFLLYPQAPHLVRVGSPRSSGFPGPSVPCDPGPADHRMYVVDAIRKDQPYDSFDLPPYRGARNPPVRPGPDGHFDHLEPGTRAFMAAHMYGSIRFVLDVWEGYLGGEFPWHFAEDFGRLELVPLVGWDNAQCGYGFIETGFARMGSTRSHPFCLDFDVLAHELGHAIIYSLLGLPPVDRVSAEFFGLPRVRRGLCRHDRGTALRLRHQRPPSRLARKHLSAERAEPNRRTVRN